MKNGKGRNRKYAGIIALCLLLCGVASCALAWPWEAKTELEPGQAAVKPQKSGQTAALYAEPSDRGEVLMEYAGGTQLTVIELEDRKMARVRIGGQQAALEGYMRIDALTNDLSMLREQPIQRFCANLGRKAPVYSACDKDAPVIGWTNEQETLLICGRGNGWAQLCSDCVVRDGGWLSSPSEGFIRVEAASVEMSDTDVDSWNVPPVEGELTYEQAYERAIELALQNPEWLIRLPEEMKNEEGLRAMWFDIRLTYNAQQKRATWWVGLQNGEENWDQNADIWMEADGTLMDITAGNG